jgi:3-hydroxyisobutyrate dehydrogenase
MEERRQHRPRVAFVGLGRMGLPVVANIVAGGYAVTATDRRAETAGAARAVGATWRARAADAVASAQVVMTMLPGPGEVFDAMLGSGAVLAAMDPGATWIDLTSSTADAGGRILDEARRRNVSVLDAPVGGGPDEARTGTLSLFVGGNEDTLAEHLPLLEALADPAHITHVGPNGSGYTTKLLVNLLWFGQVVATTEVLLLARDLGLDLMRLQRVLAQSAASSDYIRHGIPELLAGNYLPAFEIDRCYEELAGITALAAARGVPSPLSDLVAETYRRARDRYGSRNGELLAAALLQEEAGISLHDPVDPPDHS